jgi:hypothetical protein
MTLAPLFFSASRLPLLSLLLLCHLTISLPLASPSSRCQQLPTIQSTFPSAQPTLLPLRVLTCTFWSRVPPPFHEVTMRIHSYAATVSLIPEANHSFPPGNKQTHSLPTPPGYTYHPTTRGLNLPGAPNPSHLPHTHTFQHRLTPGPTHLRTHRITALPIYTNGEMSARFFLHTSPHCRYPRRCPPLPHLPISAPRAHPVRIPPLILPPPRQRIRHMLLSKSKTIASKIPVALMAVTAPFLTEMFARYTWGDKYCYVFPFWL